MLKELMRNMDVMQMMIVLVMMCLSLLTGCSANYVCGCEIMCVAAHFGI